MVYEEELLRERIQRLIHREGLTQKGFAEKIGKSSSNFNHIMKGLRNFPKDFTSSVLKAFPSVNKAWLLFGEGAMYVHEEEEEDKKQIDTKPRLPRTMSDGHIPDYIDGDKRPLCQEKRIVEQLPDYDFSLFLKTDRMSPNYRRGDELFFKKTSIVEPGNCLLLDTSEGPKFKKIYPEKDCIRCVSFNRDEYPDFTIPRNLVFGFYKCVGVIRIL